MMHQMFPETTMNPLTEKTEEKQSSKSTERAKQFRQRLASDQLRRWEIFVSDKTREEVKDIAKIEDLSPGIAAQSLLALGVETYKQRQIEQASFAEKNSPSIGNPFFANASASAALDGGLGIQGVINSVNSLSSYSSRLDERRVEAKRGDADPTKAMSNFFNKVKKTSN